MQNNSFALITGASKGIGKAIAREFASRGRNVLLIARNEELLQQTSREIESEFKIRAAFLAIDLSKQRATESVLEWCTQNNFSVDVLVNNAGYGLSGPFENYTLDDHLNMMELNMATVVRMTHIFLPILKQQPRSYILNIASSAGYQATPFLSLYSATKSFVIVFSRGLRHELKKTNVSLTCISPGSTDTEFNDRARLGEKGRKLAQKVHMTPEAVARIAVDSMYKRKSEVIVGFLNKMGAFLVWLLPKKMVENAAAKIYQ